LRKFPKRQLEAEENPEFWNSAYYHLAQSQQTAEFTPTMAAPGFESLESRYSVHETIDRLEALLGLKGIKVFARLDQAAEAQAVGIPMRPMVLLIFGDPKTGSPLMDEYPSLAIDLPLKALAWKSREGKVYLSFNSADYLAERHHLAGKPFKAVEALFAQAASATVLSPE
jgi:uncharacterized protein (DUF302 family)